MVSTYERKGVEDAYDYACDCIKNGSSFFNSIPHGNDLIPGQICLAPAWYEKKNRWYFEEDHYNQLDEKESTWKARILDAQTYPSKITGYVKKFFQLREDELLIATAGKRRHVILLKNYISDWINPNSRFDDVEYWLCLPLFSYQKYHNQDHVLKDQKLINPTRFYIPAAYKECIGCEKESASHFNAIQMVNKKYLEPRTCISPQYKMAKPYCVSQFALKVIMYHFVKNLGLFDLFLDQPAGMQNKDDYNNFFYLVNEYIEEVCSKAN